MAEVRHHKPASLVITLKAEGKVISRSKFTLDLRGVQGASSEAAEAGVVSVAPRKSELGAGWSERMVNIAIDPLEDPVESVNEFASQNPTNRANVVQLYRKALSNNGSVAMGEPKRSTA